MTGTSLTGGDSHAKAIPYLFAVKSSRILRLYCNRIVSKANSIFTNLTQRTRSPQEDRQENLIKTFLFFAHIAIGKINTRKKYIKAKIFISSDEYQRFSSVRLLHGEKPNAKLASKVVVHGALCCVKFNC